MCSVKLSDGKITLICGDCFNVLSSIATGSVNTIITDPPYEINYLRLKWDNKGSIDWSALFVELFRILTDTGQVLMCMGWTNSIPVITAAMNCGFVLNDWIVYDRIKGRGTKRNLVSTHEDILHFIKNDTYTFNKIYSNIPKKTKGMGVKNGQLNRALSNVWTDIPPLVPWSKERVNHPTQKPLQLLNRLVTVYTNESDFVLDPFLGSGTTAVACRNLNRRCIGVELDKEYFDIAVKRVNGELS